MDKNSCQWVLNPILYEILCIWSIPMFFSGKMWSKSIFTFYTKILRLWEKIVIFLFYIGKNQPFYLKIEMIYVCLVSLGLIFLEIDKIKSISNSKVGEKHQYHQVPQNFWSCDSIAKHHIYSCNEYIWSPRDVSFTPLPSIGLLWKFRRKYK